MSPVGSGTGAALRLLAALVSARNVVEIGTGTGVSGLWLLAGMRADGVLTSVDVEAEHQRLAREAFAEAGIAHQRTRLIAGRALDVLPRLSDGAYDLVLCDGDKREYGAYLEQALRLLRPGGVVAFDNALWPRPGRRPRAARPGDGGDPRGRGGRPRPRGPRACPAAGRGRVARRGQTLTGNPLPSTVTPPALTV